MEQQQQDDYKFDIVEALGRDQKHLNPTSSNVGGLCQDIKNCLDSMDNSHIANLMPLSMDNTTNDSAHNEDYACLAALMFSSNPDSPTGIDCSSADSSPLSWHQILPLDCSLSLPSSNLIGDIQSPQSTTSSTTSTTPSTTPPTSQSQQQQQPSQQQQQHLQQHLQPHHHQQTQSWDQTNPERRERFDLYQNPSTTKSISRGACGYDLLSNSNNLLENMNYNECEVSNKRPAAMISGNRMTTTNGFHQLMDLMDAVPNSATVANSRYQQVVASAVCSDASMVQIRKMTKLHSHYWRNHRKNLQCFPFCKMHTNNNTLFTCHGKCADGTIRAAIDAVSGGKIIVLGRLTLFATFGDFPTKQRANSHIGKIVSREKITQMMNNSWILGDHVGIEEAGQWDKSYYIYEFNHSKGRGWSVEQTVYNFGTEEPLAECRKITSSVMCAFQFKAFAERRAIDTGKLVYECILSAASDCFQFSSSRTRQRRKKKKLLSHQEANPSTCRGNSDVIDPTSHGVEEDEYGDSLLHSDITIY